MKRLTVLCNVVLAALSLMIVVTEGFPRQPAYLALTVLMVLVPIVMVFVMARTPGSGGPLVPCVAILCNLLLLGLTAWAIVVQYPYPEGPSVIPFAVLAVLTPALSVAALRRAARPGPPAS
jgi:hypothetical protein